MSVPPKKVKKVPAPPTAGSSTGPAANTEERALGKVVVEGYTRLSRRTRLIFGVTVGLVGLTGLYLQPVLNRFKLDKGTVQRHREIVDEERKRQRGSKDS